MNFTDRMHRKRELALLEVQSLASIHKITTAELQQLDQELVVRRRRLAAHIAAVQSLMETHQITLEEILDFDGNAPQRNRVTHRHPETGETWDGLGAQPEWLRKALTAGYRPAELRVLPETAATDPFAS